MKRFTDGMPSHSTVAAYLALFVALGGVSYAAVTLPKDSVGNRQIEKGAVRSPEVKDGSLACKDLSAKDGVCGKGVTREVTAPIELTCKDSSPAPGFFARLCTAQEVVTASCGKGRLLSGGFKLPDPPPAGTTPQDVQSGAAVIETKPDSAEKPDGWAVEFSAFGTSSANSLSGLQVPPNPEVTVYALCAA